MFVLLTFLLGSTLVSAQDTRFYQARFDHGEVTSATERFISDLDRSGQVDHALRATALRFYQETQMGSATAGNTYRDLRRGLHARQLSDDVLDSWDAVVAAWQRSGGSPRRIDVNPVPDRGWRHDRRGTRGVYFQGTFETTPVSLFGADVESLQRECLAYVSRVRPSYVDDIDVFGTRHHNGPAYWNHEQLCSLAAANARSLAQGSRGVVVEGTIEDTPFHFEGSPVDVLHAIRTIVPSLVGRGSIDDVVVNGQRYHNGPSYWRAEEVAALIEQGLGPVAYY